MTPNISHGGLFLDRDGIINIETGYVWKQQDFRFQDGIFELVKWAKSRRMPVIVITNQGGIAKKLYTENNVNSLHRWMQSEFSNRGFSLSDIFFCPHHPEVSICLCRKPHTLLFERGLAKYQLNASKSIMLGDQQRDLLPAKQLGMKTIYVGNNPNIIADVIANDLTEALVWLEKNSI